MKKQLKTTHRLAAPADAVWARIRTGEGVDIWFPPITACRVEGKRRYCEAGEARLEETIERSDDAARVFVYSIQQQNLMPVTDIVGEMRVEADGADHCRLHWDVTFEVADETTFAAVKAGTEQMYAAGAAGLERLALEPQA